MRKLILYLRQCFCKHEWELLNSAYVYEDTYTNMPLGRKWTYRCKKCGYTYTHQDYK